MYHHPSSSLSSQRVICSSPAVLCYIRPYSRYTEERRCRYLALSTGDNVTGHFMGVARDLTWEVSNTNAWNEQGRIDRGPSLSGCLYVSTCLSLPLSLSQSCASLCFHEVQSSPDYTHITVMMSFKNGRWTMTYKQTSRTTKKNIFH